MFHIWNVCTTYRTLAEVGERSQVPVRENIRSSLQLRLTGARSRDSTGGHCPCPIWRRREEPGQDRHALALPANCSTTKSSGVVPFRASRGYSSKPSSAERSINSPTRVL